MKYITVDDEPLARKAISMLARKYDELECVGQFNSAEAAAAFMESNAVDLAFLDINMPGMTGLELARTLPGDVMVIFTTAYSEYAAESYEVDAVDYLVKPVEPKRFAHAVDKALALAGIVNDSADSPEEMKGGTKSGGDSFFVKADRRNHKVRYDEILYVQGLKDYVVIQMDTRKLVTHMNLATISPLLPSDRFMRVSKSYIVNLDRIDSFDNNDIYIDDHVVPLGTPYRDTLQHRLLEG